MLAIYLPPQNLDFGARTDITITIKSRFPFKTGYLYDADVSMEMSEEEKNKHIIGTTEMESRCIVMLSKRGSVFTIGRGVTLILQDITLNGFYRNTAPLIVINSGGALDMREGARVADNVYETDYFMNNVSEAGGVWVKSGASFRLDGGYIINNMANSGGGVKVDEGASFEMITGEICLNQADYGGGGVTIQMVPGNFSMFGGVIKDNVANYFGGGISNDGGYFNMRGGEIINNRAAYQGGGYS